MPPAKAPAAWPAYVKLLPVLLAFLIYLAVISRFPVVTQVKWRANPAAHPSSHASLVLSSSNASSPTSAATQAAAEDSSSSKTVAAVPNAALLAATKQPVVIGLQRSGQWPFWQAMHAPDRISDIGVRATTNMQGTTMNEQHPDWVSSSCCCYQRRRCMM
jgi:cytoskeletal protein RodZ